MFGFAKRGQELKRLQDRENELSERVQQAESRAQLAEASARSLESQNRVLAAKVHRMTLNHMLLQDEHHKLNQDHKDLQLRALSLESEAQVARHTAADAWEVPELRTALRQQAAQQESKIARIKQRTQALLTALLPGSVRSSHPAPPSQSVSVVDASQAELLDTAACPPALPDGPLDDINTEVLRIVGCLYDDTLSEDQALEQLTELAQPLIAQAPQSLPSEPLPPRTSGTVESRGCSPLRPDRLLAGRTDEELDATFTEAGKMDAATDTRTPRLEFMRDAATETPAVLSYVGSPHDLSAAPSIGSTPRHSGLVPQLDLASLVSQALEAAPPSNRSVASTSAGGASSSMSVHAFSQFVLAQPEKLQRLIMRHAAATSANKMGQQQPQAQSAFGGAMSSGGSLGRAGSLSSGPELPPMAGGSSMATRLTSRMLGLSNTMNANRPTATAPQSSGSAGTAGVVLPSAPSPAVAAKRAGSGIPKFAVMDGTAAQSQAKPAAAPSCMPHLSLSGMQQAVSDMGPMWGAGKMGGGATKGHDTNLGMPVIDAMGSDLKDLPSGGGSALSVLRLGGKTR